MGFRGVWGGLGIAGSTWFIGSGFQGFACAEPRCAEPPKSEIWGGHCPKMGVGKTLNPQP